MENKEKLAEKYCYEMQLAHDRNAERTFIDGYDACQEQADKFAIGFAEWLDAEGYMQIHENKWWNGSNVKYTIHQLLNTYKQSLKQ